MKISAAQFDVFDERAHALAKRLQVDEPDCRLLVSERMPKSPRRIEVLVTWRTKNKVRGKYMPYTYWLLPADFVNKVARAFYTHRHPARKTDESERFHIAVFADAKIVGFEACGHNRLFSISSRLPECTWEMFSPENLQRSADIIERKIATS